MNDQALWSIFVTACLTNNFEWGIHVTQVTPRCSMRRCGGLSARSGRVRGALFDRGGVPRLPGEAALARRVSLPGLRP